MAMKARRSSKWFVGLALLAIAGVNPGAAQTPSATELEKPKPAPVESQQKPLTTKHLSGWYAELVKLVQAGIQDSVLVSFIDSSGTFNATPEEIIYLRDLGVSSDVINIMLQHDAEIALGLRTVVAGTAPATPLPFTTAAPTVRNPAKEPLIKAFAPSGQASANDTIVNASESPDFNFLVEPGEDRGAQATDASYRVREPYPVPLTNPIIVMRGPSVTPNLVLIRSFP